MPALARTTDTFEPWTDASLAHWQPASFPDGQGGTWAWAEPGAKVAVKRGWLELSVPRFTRSHGQVQIFDNPKHLLACARPIPVPDEGLWVEVEMAGEVHHPKSDSWSDGFVSFNLMDFEHGLVLDGLATSKRTAVLFERLNIPGLVPQEQAFTAIGEGPASQPGEVHRFRFEVEPGSRAVRGFVDGRQALEMRNIPARIRSFTPGFGLITLSPIRDGKSTSLHGQGATGRLGAIRTGTLP
jgi:hypothetical protein